jgi:hypothetical protein
VRDSVGELLAAYVGDDRAGHGELAERHVVLRADRVGEDLRPAPEAVGRGVTDPAGGGVTERGEPHVLDGELVAGHHMSGSTVVQVTRTPSASGIEQAIVPPMLRILASRAASPSRGTTSMCQVMTRTR